MSANDAETPTWLDERARVVREAREIRRLCRKQRRELSEQFNRLQVIRRTLKQVSQALEESRNELFENRMLLLNMHRK